MKRLPGWMGRHSLRWLAERAAASECLVEVGCWLGRSTKVMAHATKGVVYAVDTWQGTPADTEQHERLYASDVASMDVYQRFTANLRREIQARKVVPVRMDSVSAAKMFADKGVRFDFVFVDADHSYAGCAGDIDAYLPLVRAGGVIAGHDYHPNWPGVLQAVDERFGAPQRGPGSIWWVHA
jgi:predicted O-methyltransferase YrrM